MCPAPRNDVVSATSMARARPTLGFISVVLAASACLLLVLGLTYANLFVTDPPPNVVITLSHKGLSRLFVELISLGIAGVGLVLALGAAAVIKTARNRLLMLATIANAAVCVVCVVLLI